MIDPYMIFVLAEDRTLVIVEEEQTIWVPGEVRVIEVQDDGSTW